MVLGSTCSSVTEITASVANLSGLQQLDEFMKQELILADIEVVSTQMFTTNPEICADNLKKNDARIIIGSMYEDKAKMLLCAIYNNTPEAERPNAWYKKIVWLLPSMFFKHWMDVGGSGISCTPDQIQEVLGNYFTIGSQTLTKDSSYVPFSGITDFNILLNGTILYNSVQDVLPSDLKKYFDRDSFYLDGSLSGQHRAPQAYDAVWAIALALNNTLTYLKQTNDSRRLENFTYNDSQFSRLLHEGMKNVTFKALSGDFHFNPNGERENIIAISQYNKCRDGYDKYTAIGNCTKKNDTDSWSCFLNKSAIVWSQGKTPVDGVQQKIKLININCKYRYIFWGVSCLGIVLTLALLVFNVTKRKHRIVKMSSPNINNVILLGCLMAYSTVFIMDYARSGAHVACVAHTFLLILSFSLCFGALFAKTWRVYEIFTTELKVLKTKMLKDGSLFLIVAVLVIVNNLMLVGWVLASPQAPTLVNISTTPSESDKDIEYINQYQKCDSKYRLHFTSAVLAIQGIVILFGTFLAIQTRKVTCPELNDSKWIALCIYNVVVLSPVGVVVVMATSDKPEINYALEASMVTLITAMTECLIFVPKILAYRNHAPKVNVKRSSQLHDLAVVERTASSENGRLCRRCEASLEREEGSEQSLTSGVNHSKVLDIRETDLISLNTKLLFSLAQNPNLRKVFNVQVDKVIAEIDGY
ncbi:gamma-aminobutyric acid type B receptor subunit 2 [Biomphalaria glabrata]|nr:gamma-aminobutyric acid type B receptor subunit 2 [Biomphalaria glabrata]